MCMKRETSRPIKRTYDSLDKVARGPRRFYPLSILLYVIVGNYIMLIS